MSLVLTACKPPIGVFAATDNLAQDPIDVEKVSASSPQSELDPLVNGLHPLQSNQPGVTFG